MPFELESDFDEAPFTDAFDVIIIEFLLGADTELDQLVLMSVMLVPVDGVHDIRFGIRLRDPVHEWRVTPPDYTREAVAKYVPKEHRQEVLEALLRALRCLVEHSGCDTLTMETFYANLPAYAMAKYTIICNELAESGYVTKDTFRDETSGKDYWLFERTG